MATESTLVPVTAYAALLERIANGTLPPGAWLREEALAEELGTSRTPVREALRTLAAEGLVEIVRNRGAQVRNWSAEQLEETYSLRATLEGYAAQRATTYATAADAEGLRAIQTELERIVADREPGWLDALADANARFHHRIIELSHSTFLGGFVSTLHSASFVRRAFRGYSEQDLQRTITHHRDIVTGIATGNAALSSASMQAHILAAIPAAQQVLHHG